MAQPKAIQKVLKSLANAAKGTQLQQGLKEYAEREGLISTRRALEMFAKAEKEAPLMSLQRAFKPTTKALKTYGPVIDNGIDKLTASSKRNITIGLAKTLGLYGSAGAAGIGGATAFKRKNKK